MPRILSIKSTEAVQHMLTDAFLDAMVSAEARLKPEQRNRRATAAVWHDSGEAEDAESDAELVRFPVTAATEVILDIHSDPNYWEAALEGSADGESWDRVYAWGRHTVILGDGHHFHVRRPWPANHKYVRLLRLAKSGVASAEWIKWSVTWVGS